MAKTKNFPLEVRERAIRLVYEARSSHDSEWATICSVASKIGCGAETLRKWIRRAQPVAAETAPTADQERIRQLERENRELQRANQILRLASAYFAQAELDRLPK